MDKTKHSIFSNLRFWSEYFLKYEPQIFWISVADILFGPLVQMLALYFPKVTLTLVERQAPPEKLLLVLGIYTLAYLAVRGISHGLVAYNEMTLNEERQNVVYRLFLKSLRIVPMPIRNPKKGGTLFAGQWESRTGGTVPQAPSLFVSREI